MRNFSSRLAAVAAATLALLLVPACSETKTEPEPEQKSLVAGNWIGYYPSYVSLILRENNGVITGSAAVPITGPANVTGTRNGTAISLQFTANRSTPPATVPAATFQGTVSDSGITGTLSQPSGTSKIFTFARADTVAEGYGRFTVVGGPFAAADSGVSFFTVAGIGMPLTIRRADGYQVQLTLPVRKIAPGTYPIGILGEGEFGASITFNRAGLISFSGQVKIDLARTKAIAGSFSFLGLGGEQVTGSFSAFCVTDPCMPAN